MRPVEWFVSELATGPEAIDALPGQEAAGTDIHMPPRIQLGISGVVTGMPAGANVTVDIEGNIAFHLLPIIAGPDPRGAFAIDQLPAGKYTLTAIAEAGGQRLLSAPLQIDLSDSPAVDVTDSRLNITAGKEITALI